MFIDTENSIMPYSHTFCKKEFQYFQQRKQRF